MTAPTATDAENSPIIVTEHQANQGKKINQLTLNSQPSLNALTLDMIQTMTGLLKQWQTQPQVACVVLDGAGTKAFCAGGDIRKIYRGMTEPEHAGFCQQFFSEEYELDYLIHTYEKPLICWGSGIVMGGGLGLMAGAGYRVVTETSHIAMPEVSIGLYPDVGGTWFLNRMPRKVGLFLALTGAPMNAADARFVGLADFFLNSADKGAMLKSLMDYGWEDIDEAGEANEAYHQGVNEVLTGYQSNALGLLPDSNLIQHFDLIHRLMSNSGVVDVVGAIEALKTDDQWLQKAQRALTHGSPAAMAIIHNQLEIGRHFSLKEVFISELGLSVNCARAGEFAEGVRALLIDKDGQPHWRFDTVSAVDQQWLDILFTDPWFDTEHPLVGL